MSSTPPRPPSVRIPQQQRSREKFDAMVKAAEKLFAEQGIPETSVQQIVEAAGVSIGAFYQRFENKDALIHTIFSLLAGEIARITDAVNPATPRSLEQTVRVFTTASVQFYIERRGVFLALLLAVQKNPGIRAYVFDLRNTIGGIYTEALAAHKAEIGHKRFRKAAAMSLRVLNAYLDQCIIWAGFPAEEANLAYKVSDRELAQVLLSYLRDHSR